MMTKSVAVCLSSLLFATCASAAASAAASAPPQARTLYWYAEQSWAVGTLTLGKPLTFREGRILVFPSQISDLLWAPNDTKPRNLMLVYEVPSDHKDSPMFSQHDQVFAPVRLLPDYSYWKDNLPKTPRHQVHGGARYVFRGDEIAPVRAVLGEFFAARKLGGFERWKGQMRAVASGLESPVAVVREDSARFIAAWPSLARDVDETSLERIAAFLRGDAAAEHKGMVIDALAAQKVGGVAPVLEGLAGREDATGAAALGGLEALGQPVPTERLLALSRASSPEMRAWAAGALGRRAASDAAALERCRAILAEPAADPAVVGAATSGLAQAGGKAATELLAACVAKGDATSRLSALALATIGGPEALAALTGILTGQQGEAARAAAAGIGSTPGCAECARVLREQHEKHPDPAVRQLIGVLLEVPVEHKH